MSNLIVMSLARFPSSRRPFPFVSAALTGASSGIGAAMALALAQPGVTLFLAGRNGSRLDAVGETCRTAGAEVRLERFDVTDSDAAEAWVRNAEVERPLDLLVANAGISTGRRPDGSAESPSDARQVIAVNLIGAMNVAFPALDAMVGRRAGHLLVISSIAALRGLPHSPAYSAAKAGLLAWAEGIRATMRPQGVTVSVALPGFVRSPMSDRVIGPKPFLEEPQRAAHILLAGTAAGLARIVFPWPLAMGLRIASALPGRWGDAILMRLPGYVEPQ